VSTVVIALGGNAILQAGQKGTHQEQQENIRTAAESVAELVKAGHRVIVTHGNGPQVGNVLIQQEESAALVPPMPLDVCGAQTQGMLGYMFQQELGNALRRRGLAHPVATIVTQTEVRADDPAFAEPAKPVGPYYTPERAQRAMAEKGWKMKEDKARGGWRRVVASPKPMAIVERESIVRLVEAGALVVAAGGGGAPVVRQADGSLQGVEAVIDKDLAGYSLAMDVKADVFMILTDVKQVAIRFGTPEQENLGNVTLAGMRAYQQEGHFKAGSMGPKVDACLQFVEATGGRAVIAALSQALDAVDGTAGTQIVSGK
jgi:carbamate kinase